MADPATEFDPADVEDGQRDSGECDRCTMAPGEDGPR